MARRRSPPRARRPARSPRSSCPPTPRGTRPTASRPWPRSPRARPVGADAVARCATVLRSGEPAMLMLTDRAVREHGLALAGRIATATGRAPHRPGLATRASSAAPAACRSSGCPTRSTRRSAVLKDVRHLILVGAKAPVAFFAYPDKPSVLTPDGCQMHQLSTLAEDSIAALEALADAVGAKKNSEVVQSLRSSRAADGRAHARHAGGRARRAPARGRDRRRRVGHHRPRLLQGRPRARRRTTG